MTMKIEKAKEISDAYVAAKLEKEKREDACIDKLYDDLGSALCNKAYNMKELKRYFDILPEYFTSYYERRLRERGFMCKMLYTKEGTYVYAERMPKAKVKSGLFGLW